MSAAAEERDAAHAPLAEVGLLALDFDGVLTDNRVLVDQDGREAVWCHRGDGWGIARLRDDGVAVAVFSTEANPVVAARCRKLGIPCVQGLAEKRGALARFAQELGVARARVAYVGNDVNDLDCLRWAGVPIAVADAEAEVLAAAALVTRRRGGYGAVREVADLILGARAAAPARGTTGRNPAAAAAGQH